MSGGHIDSLGTGMRKEMVVAALDAGDFQTIAEMSGFVAMPLEQPQGQARGRMEGIADHLLI